MDALKDQLAAIVEQVLREAQRRAAAERGLGADDA